MLETAQARQTGSGQESEGTKPRPADHPRNLIQAATHSPSGHSTPPAAQILDGSAGRTELSESAQPEDSGEGPEPIRSEIPTLSHQAVALSPEMLLAAGLVPQPLTEAQATTPAPAPSAEEPHVADATVDRKPSGTPRTPVTADPTFAQSNADMPRVTTPPPAQTAGSVTVDAITKHAPAPSAHPVKAADVPTAPTVDPEAAPLVDRNTQAEPLETLLNPTDASSTATSIDPDKVTSSITRFGSQITPKPASGTETADRSHLESPPDAPLRTSDAATGQTTAGADQFLERDDQPSSESREGTTHSRSPVPLTEDKTIRPQVPDAATGINASAPPSHDRPAEREVTGQPALAHASETERLNELRGSYPSAQTVTLDLDPLDMGPLRVRIMMTEQTVHAHIRTEHGELGQGLLQQGQSLEASLRTTGLEMGMLRVTVDQQQQGRGDNPWVYQQQQGRPGSASAGSSGMREEDRGARSETELYNNGRVSFFA